MNDQAKTKAELLKDISVLMKKIRKLEKTKTAYKQVEEALLESEKKYRLIAENTADLISILDMNLRFTYVSPASMSLRGFTVEEAMGQTLDQVLTPESMQIALTVFEKEMELEASGTADPDRTRILELEEYKKDGSIIWVEVNLSFLRDKDRKSVEILIVSRDITDRKRAEEALRRSEVNYRQLFDNAPAGIYQIDYRTGKLLKANDVVCEYIGCSQEEITSFSPFDMLSPESQQLFLERIIKINSGEKVTENPEFETIDRNGKKRWVQLNTKNFYDSEGLVIGADIVAHEITERKQAEQEKRNLEERLQRAEKMEALGTLAGGVAHDLNNVLGVIVGYAELLLVEVDKLSPMRPHLTKIMKGSEKAAVIVQDLLTLARRGVPGRKVLNLNKIILDYQNSPELEKLSAYHSAVHIKLDLESGLLNISGSSVHLSVASFH